MPRAEDNDHPRRKALSVCSISCSCLPEMKKDPIYKIKIDTSDVCGAECSCPAGRGPHASCKHVAASLFALEDFSSTYKNSSIFR